ncbi:glycosyltransferase family 4 protein [Streptomyces zagrosensis]|uniref:Glycosyltransferase involved in cell wall biosynthesis n=1 Tax=Streptomyces zagrosensis TaxID=1042984 RepID=A0A7W9QDY6_9ACTN|nr:glycosyltransferase family 4 protein [Streptomyces zagrosensis]MBB5937467.1 glycosyltransferase involved in cell wall biosynthesis [Streptomyces zagrosensis]
MSRTVSSPPAPLIGPDPLHAVQVLGSGASGSGVHVRSLAAGLVARGLRVTVCGPESAELAYEFGAAGAQFVRVGPCADVESLTALRAVCADAGLVHAHGTKAGLLASLALGGRRTPLVVTWHTKSTAKGARARVLQLAERRVARAARIALGASSDLVDRARQRGARDARLAPVAVPAPRWLPQEEDRRQHKARAELGAVERPLLFTVGRLEENRGHDVLLDAVWAWRSYDPAPLLVIAGEGPGRAWLQGRIEAEGLPVRLLGRRDDVTELLAAADVAVLPSRWEARSLFAQEALHAGVPLVATAVGGVPELVGDAAELVPYGDPQALARAVLGLLADPARREHLAATGRAQADCWPTEDDTVAHVLGIYDELTHTSAPGSRAVRPH